MSVKQRFYTVYVVLLCIVFFVACKSDETRFGDDAVAVAKVRELNTKMNAGKQLSEAELNDLKVEFEKYPEAETVLKAYESALLLRKDWGALTDFYKMLSGPAFTDDRKKNLAKAYLKLGRYKDASETAAGFDLKTDEEMGLVAAMSLYHLGKYDESKKIFDDNWARIVSQKKVDEMTLRGMIYFYQGDNKKALEILEGVTAIDPLNVMANNGLSRVYGAEGNSESAKAAQAKVQESFDKLTEQEQIKTHEVEKANRLQEAYNAKRYEEVIELSRELIPNADPRNKLIMYQYLYNSYLSLGKEKEAREVMQEAKKFQSQ